MKWRQLLDAHGSLIFEVHLDLVRDQWRLNRWADILHLEDAGVSPVKVVLLSSCNGAAHIG